MRYSIRKTIRLSKVQDKKLQAWVKKSGESESEVIRLLIEMANTRWKKHHESEGYRVW